jgi:drug/metabolite transporter (DMT)-like permease
VAVVYAVLAAVTFGVLGVAIRAALGRGADPEVGAAAVMLVALSVSAVAAIPSAVRGFDVKELWPFLIGGALAPGASQVMLNQSVRYAGVSRPAIVIGTAPLISVLIALTLLDEPFRAALLAGTLVVVAGGVALVREQARPASWRPLGLVLALLCALLFAARDNVFRYGARGAHPPPLVAATASLLAAAVVVFAYLAFRRRANLPRLRDTFVRFAPAGFSLAAGYDFLALALSHGRVSVVAPLNGTQSLWATLLAAILFRQSERIGPRLLAAAVMVVAGGALIGAAR